MDQFTMWRLDGHSSLSASAQFLIATTLHRAKVGAAHTGIVGNDTAIRFLVVSAGRKRRQLSALLQVAKDSMPLTATA
jgi:hypothetical protein